MVGADLGDEMAVLDMRSGSYLGFNATAAHVWRLLEQPQTAESLCDSLRSEFAVNEDRCRAAVDRLLDQFKAKGWVTASDA